jgi:hypothetical protein
MTVQPTANVAVAYLATGAVQQAVVSCLNPTTVVTGTPSAPIGNVTGHLVVPLGSAVPYSTGSLIQVAGTAVLSGNLSVHSLACVSEKYVGGGGIKVVICANCTAV